MILFGTDIGGSSVKLALIDSDDGCRITARGSFPFDGQPAEEMCLQIRGAADEMLAEAGLNDEDIKGVGVCVPGNIDKDRSTVVNAYNLGFHNVPLKALVSERFPGREVSLMNDADAAALAEYRAGALEGCENSILLTLGTGLGAGLILGGKIFLGGCGRGFELGHVPFRNGGDPCTCGLKGCMERYVSASRLARDGARELGDTFGTARAVTDAARAGNKIACRLLDDYIEDLSDAIAGICNMFDPERIAVGGGLSAAGEILFAPLTDLVERKNFYRARYEIVPARFLNDAGVLGAALSVCLTNA